MIGTEKQRVNRLYVPQVKTVFTKIGPKPFNQFFPPVLASLAVDPGMPFRDVWAYWQSDQNAAPYFYDVDLVALLDGSEVFRMKLQYQDNNWNTPPGHGTFLININNAGKANLTDDILKFDLNATTGWSTAPWRLPITCDTFQIQAGPSIRDSGANNYVAFIQVRSQRGL